MLKFYITSGILALVSTWVVLFLFKDGLRLYPRKKINSMSVFRAIRNQILLCIIPVLRWAMPVLLIVFALASDEFADRVYIKQKEKDIDNGKHRED